ncbi:MAG: CBS domain-containing protein [Candidatus Omnitrophica bacterium]|nr:CBS domain-containing protein [Candidatus Omnitrophota bacterium]
MQLSSVAPKGLIRSDYGALKSYERLDTTKEIEDLLFIQSLEGRAHNGVGVFDKRTYVNTTIDDVVRALERDPEDVKRRRQTVIDDVADFAHSVIHGEKRERLLNRSGDPILGIKLFQERRVNPRDILRGLYLGGLRDNPDVRQEAERIYQAKIGGGRCYIVDVKTLLAMQLDGEKLAHEAHGDKIEEYMRSGLIRDVEGTPDPESERYFYIRHRLGPGQSDDVAFVLAGIIYNPDVALGVFLADAVDTLEKYAPVFKDQDGELAFEIGRGFKDLRITLEEVYELTALAAIPEAEEHLVPDSSLRYFLSLDQQSGICAFRSHLNFMEGKPVIPLPVSFKRIPSTQFYAYVNRRLANVKKLEKLAVPNLTVRELGVPVGQLLKKNFSVVSKEATLADVIRKFKETKCEVIIVQDKNDKVLGTIDPADLMYLLGETGGRHVDRSTDA